jgi:hypothetical protein
MAGTPPFKVAKKSSVFKLTIEKPTLVTKCIARTHEESISIRWRTTQASVFAGTRAILIALDLPEGEIKGLQGFAFRRSDGSGDSHWLQGMKVFPTLAPKDTNGKVVRFPTNENPIQSFLWSDYEAKPDTQYTFEVSAMYGEPGHLQPRETVVIKVKTETEDDG